MKTILICAVAMSGALGCSSAPDAGDYAGPRGQPLLTIPASAATTAETRVERWLYFRDGRTSARVGITAGGEVITDTRVTWLGTGDDFAVELSTELPTRSSFRVSSQGDVESLIDDGSPPSAVIARRALDDVEAHLRFRNGVTPYQHCQSELDEMTEAMEIFVIAFVAWEVICATPGVADCAAATAALAYAAVRMNNATDAWIACFEAGICENLACGAISPHTGGACSCDAHHCLHPPVPPDERCGWYSNDCSVVVNQPDGSDCSGGTSGAYHCVDGACVLDDEDNCCLNPSLCPNDGVGMPGGTLCDVSDCHSCVPDPLSPENYQPPPPPHCGDGVTCLGVCDACNVCDGPCNTTCDVCGVCDGDGTSC